MLPLLLQLPRRRVRKNVEIMKINARSLTFVFESGYFSVVSRSILPKKFPPAVCFFRGREICV
ncbi:hypothetical protein B5F35_03840 [Anaeromassilibacillus sp. An200]|nr:hypothetical protein B5F35_03840 [Anaeromassilibacillus sp. An200]